MINTDYWSKVFLKSRERSSWRDARLKTQSETAAGRVCKNINIQASILPDTYNAEAFAGCRGLDNNRILPRCSNARTSRAFLDSLLKSPDLATYQRGKSSKVSFLCSMNETLKRSSHSSAANQNASISSFGVPIYAETEVMVSICRIRKLFSSVN